MTGKLSRRLPSWPSCGQAQGQKLSPGDCVLAILIPVDLPKGWLFFFFFLSPICKHPTKLLRPALYCTGRSTEDLHTRHPTLPGRVLNKALSLYIDLLFMLKEAPVFTKLLTGLRPRVLPVLFCCFVFFFPQHCLAQHTRAVQLTAGWGHLLPLPSQVLGSLQSHHLHFVLLHESESNWAGTLWVWLNETYQHQHSFPFLMQAVWKCSLTAIWGDWVLT